MHLNALPYLLFLSPEGFSIFSSYSLSLFNSKEHQKKMASGFIDSSSFSMCMHMIKTKRKRLRLARKFFLKKKELRKRLFVCNIRLLLSSSTNLENEVSRRLVIKLFVTLIFFHDYYNVYIFTPQSFISPRL